MELEAEISMNDLFNFLRSHILVKFCGTLKAMSKHKKCWTHFLANKLLPRMNLEMILYAEFLSIVETFIISRLRLCTKSENASLKPWL